MSVLEKWRTRLADVQRVHPMGHQTITVPQHELEELVAALAQASSLVDLALTGEPGWKLAFEAQKMRAIF